MRRKWCAPAVFRCVCCRHPGSPGRGRRGRQRRSSRIPRQCRQGRTRCSRPPCRSLCLQDCIAWHRVRGMSYFRSMPRHSFAVQASRATLVLLGLMAPRALWARTASQGETVLLVIPPPPPGASNPPLPGLTRAQCGANSGGRTDRLLDEVALIDRRTWCRGFSRQERRKRSARAGRQEWSARQERRPRQGRFERQGWCARSSR